MGTDNNRNAMGTDNRNAIGTDNRKAASRGLRNSNSSAAAETHARSRSCVTGTGKRGAPSGSAAVVGTTRTKAPQRTNG